MRIYIISRFEARFAIRNIMKIFQSHGHTITRDWTRAYPPPKATDRLKRIIMGEITKKNMRGVRNADAVVFFPPGRRGAHGELTMALALNKNCLLVGKQELGCMPVCHPDIIVCKNISEALLILERIKDPTWLLG